MRNLLLFAGIAVLIAVAAVFVLNVVRTPKEDEIVSVRYDAQSGWSVGMICRTDGFLFTYYPSAEQERVETLRGAESFDTLLALLRETGIEPGSASAESVAGEDPDTLTITYSGGRTRVLTRPEEDEAFRSIRSCLMEFSGFCR